MTRATPQPPRGRSTLSRIWRSPNTVIKLVKHHVQLRAAAREDAALAGSKEEGGLPMPSPRLRHRVSGSVSRASYLDIGRACAEDITNLLRFDGEDRPVYSFRSVLDFGCGCARTLRHFVDRPASCRLHGTDIDETAIAWCRDQLQDLASWSVNPHLPPMSYEDGSFDLIYALSVFTHLDEEYQFAWLEELRRVARPGAILILTTHGDAMVGPLSEKERAYLAETGFYYKKGTTGRAKLDGLPDFYQTTYHTREYIAREWSKYFTLLRHVDKGMARSQDAVILRRD